MLSTTLKRSSGLQARGFGAIGFARYSPDTASHAWFRGHLEHEFEILIAIAGNAARTPRHVLGQHSRDAGISLGPARAQSA